MQYDLAVLGGGPAGLTAARTAAEAGLRVILIEKRRDFLAPFKSAASLFYFQMLAPEFYLDPISVELSEEVRQAENVKTPPAIRFNFKTLGFSVDYSGPILPYYNYLNLSVSGHQVYSYKDELWSFCFSREIFSSDLNKSAEKAGVKILPGHTVNGIVNTGSSVTVTAKSDTNNLTITAKKVIAADGMDSFVAESIGLNKDRPVITQGDVVNYVYDGLDPDSDIPFGTTWLSINIPSVCPSGILISHFINEGSTSTKFVSAYSEEAIEKFKQLPRYKPWFNNARLIKKLGMSIVMRKPLDDLYFDNVLFTGDSNGGGLVGTTGAVAAGYMAAKTIIQILNGQADAYAAYKKWYFNTFACFACHEHDKRRIMHRLLRQVITDSEVDDIYRLLQGKLIHPPFAVFENPEFIQKENPALYRKISDLRGQIDNMKLVI
jgi:flavin-dependent dehydrogenase